MSKAETPPPPVKAGVVLHHAAAYDLTLWLLTLGRERAFREGVLRLAHVGPGESVLDVGCGTGTLAIIAKGQVGSSGHVVGVDASSEMIARARRKARRKEVQVDFTVGLAESLPLPDFQFDAVLSTVMVHHLPNNIRPRFAAEALRVLKPGGRILILDFGAPSSRKRGFVSHFHRHKHVSLPEIVRFLSGAGFEMSESGTLGIGNLHFAIGRSPLLSPLDPGNGANTTQTRL